MLNPYRNRDTLLWNDIKPVMSELLEKTKALATLANAILSKDKNETGIVSIQSMEDTSYNYFL